LSYNRIIIAPYPFKGILSGPEVAAEIADACSERFPHASIHKLPLGDGGTGTLDALVGAYEGRIQTAVCTKATGVRSNCRWGLLVDGRGVIESAEVISLASVAETERKPARLTTRGLGELLLHITGEGVTDILIGLGDTATHDCGIGMAAALGYRFLDGQGRPVEPVGESLPDIAGIDGVMV
jgi:glycerate kinase